MRQIVWIHSVWIFCFFSFLVLVFKTTRWVLASTEHCSKFKFSSQDVFSSSAELARLARCDQDSSSRSAILQNRKSHSTTEQSQWKYFRLEIEYVARLEQLATKLEQEAKIIRGFLAKNYGHFDSRWSCLAPWAIILIFRETFFSFLLILIPIADCKQSQQI